MKTYTKTEVMQRVQQVGLVPVVRASSPERAVELARAMAAGGATVMELTFTVPGAIQAIRTLVKENPEILVGAGTVLDPETARIAILEGAQFIVSPGTNVETIALCRRYSIASLPGALTPNEVIAAWQAGADVVKIFPASAMGGAKYLKSLKAPLPQIEMIPTGGVSLATAEEFLSAGAFALGVGADLADEKAIAENRAGDITAMAKKYIEVITNFRAAKR